MASTRGFQNHSHIPKAILQLYRGFGPKHLKSYPEIFSVGSSENELLKDDVIGAQRLARRIAIHYRLPVTTVIVTFSSLLTTPGRVELSHSNEFFDELQDQYRTNPKAIAAVLAPEIAHIFLHRCGVRLSNEFENEVLTDATAVYVGFGPTILNAATETKTQFGNTTTTRTHHFGYLTLDEFGYITAKRDASVGLPIWSLIVMNDGRGFLDTMQERIRARNRDPAKTTRVVFVHPLSPFLDQLIQKNGKKKSDQVGDIRRGFDALRATAVRDSAIEIRGSFGFFPSSYLICEREAFVSPYMCAERGSLPIFRFVRSMSGDDSLYQHLIDDAEAVFRNATPLTEADFD